MKPKLVVVLAPNNCPVALNVPRLTHADHVYMVDDVGVANVLFKYALAEDRKRRDLFTL